MTINQRFMQLLEAEKITQKNFCDQTGLSEKNISNIATGHVAQPKSDFFFAIANFYPEWNLTWLLTGRGEMYLSKSSPGYAQVSREPDPPPYTQTGKNEDLLKTIQSLSDTVARLSLMVNAVHALEERIRSLEAEIKKLKELK